MSKRASYQQPQAGRSQSPPTKQSPPAKVPQSPPKNTQPPAKSNQPPAKTQPPAKSAVKETPKTVAKGAFDASPWVKQGFPEDVVVEIKNAFDLFDTDQGGSIDVKGILK